MTSEQAARTTALGWLWAGMLLANLGAVLGLTLYFHVGPGATAGALGIAAPIVLALLALDSVGFLLVRRCLLSRAEQADPSGGDRRDLEQAVASRTDELTRSKQRLEAFMRAIPDLVFRTDAEGTLLDCHASSSELLYLDPQEFLGKTVEDVMPASVAAKWSTAIEAACATAGEHVFSYELDLPLGRHAFEARVVGGVPGEAFTVVRDVTEREAASKALAESEERYRSLAENSADYILRYDRGGRHVYVNEAAARVSGLSVEDMVGKTHRDMGFPEDLCALWEARIESVFETGKETGEVFEWSGAQGVVTLDWRVMPEFGADGRVIFALGVSRDISRLKEAERQRLSLERQMLHSQKLESLGVLTGGIAHDFNNLLTAILGFSSLLERRIDAHSPLLSYATSIRRSAEHAAELTSQMLAYAGRASFLVQPLDLDQLVGELGALLTASLPKGTLLKYENPPDLPAIQADATQLRQVVMNLIINASEASPVHESTVIVRTGVVDADEAYLAEFSLAGEIDTGRYVYLEVEDSGTGMDAETRDKIFDPFFTTKFQGRGLGLAAVMGIVRGHGGGLMVESAPGQGSTFRVLFPALDEAVEPEAPPAMQSDWRGNGTILVIDDEEAVRSLMDSLLSSLGFDVICAQDGQEGVRLFREQADSIALVLVDMTMPGMDGRATFEALREIRSDARIVLCSGYGQQAALSRFTPSDLAGFLSKPFEESALQDCLRAALEGGDQEGKGGPHEGA